MARSSRPHHRTDLNYHRSVPRSYDADFYDDIDAMSSASAAAIVPWVVGALSPTSVLDVGCGRGAWLAAFKAAGVHDVLGLDGDYVDRSTLHIGPDEFRAVDLIEPPALGRTFDLVVSLEVAEHLPAAAAPAFVAWLVSVAPVVLFSAAIPGQGGVNHVNEQWPDYWADQFEAVGYGAIDAVRPRFWNDDRVEFYFAQNIILYARADLSHDIEARVGPVLGDAPDVLSLVHPKMLDAVRDQARRRHQAPASVSSLVRALPGASRRALTSRWRSFTHR
jgi:SAM-dependent methyltransferase